MTFTESNIVKQMILDAVTMHGDTGHLFLHEDLLRACVD